MAATYNWTVGSVPTPTHYFGNLSAAGAAPIDVGGAGLTIVSGNVTGHWAVANSGGRTLVSPTTAGDNANLNAGPYTLILSDGNSVVLSIIENAYSIGTLAALKTRLQAGVAYGTQLLLRTGGTYSSGGETIIPVLTGTWTAPSNYAEYHQGVDLDTGNYVRVRPHPGEAVTITSRVQIYETAGTGFCRIRFTGITFYLQDPSLTSETTAAMLEIHGGANAAVDGCTFQALDSGSSTEFQRRNGFKAISRNGYQTPGLVIQDCGFYDCMQGIITGAEGAGACVVGNWIQRSWGDGVKMCPCVNLRYCWNVIVDKFRLGSGAHPDFLQMDGTSITSDITDMWVVGNLHARGIGIAAAADGQAFFMADLASPYRWVRPLIAGNFGLAHYTNNIALYGVSGRVNEITRDAIVVYNSALQDSTTTTQSCIINLDGTDVNTFQKYNIQRTASAPAGDISLADHAAYDDYFDGGQAMQGSGIGGTLAAIAANAAIKSGSSADTPGALCGAHQDIFNYLTRTITYAAMAVDVTWPSDPA